MLSLQFITRIFPLFCTLYYTITLLFKKNLTSPPLSDRMKMRSGRRLIPRRVFISPSWCLYLLEPRSEERKLYGWSLVRRRGSGVGWGDGVGGGGRRRIRRCRVGQRSAGTMFHGLGGGVRKVGRLVMVVCVRYRKISWWLKEVCACVV